MRKLAFTGSLGLLVAATLLVPLPIVVLSPGPALDVPSHLRLGTAPAPVHGRLLLLTVNLSEPSTADAVAAWFDPHREIVAREQVIPPGVDPAEYFRAQRAVFDESVRVAAAVALRAAGYEVRVSGGGARIAAVIKGSPADGRLEVGDVVTEANGREVRVATDLAAATSGGRSGDRVTLGVRRGEDTRTVTVTLERVSQLDRPGLGVALETVTPTIDLPFTVSVEDSDIGGPSAGLMLALSIYDLAHKTDLAAGRVIAGTGTLDLDGRVGPIGGIAEKVVSAERAGATVFLAPASQAADARRAAGADLHVVSVSTFADALDALRGGLPS